MRKLTYNKKLNKKRLSKLIIKQARQIMKRLIDFDYEVCFPITEKGIITDVRFIGSRHDTWFDINELKDMVDSPVIGTFHTHPHGECDFSRNDIRSAILGGELVTAVGVPRTGCVKILFLDEYRGRI